jgi:hypothetical protein
MSGGATIGLFVGAVVGGIVALAAATVGGAFTLVHGTKLISAGDNLSGSMYLGLGGLLVLPIVYLVAFGIWNLGRQVFVGLGRPR